MQVNRKYKEHKLKIQKLFRPQRFSGRLMEEAETIPPIRNCAGGFIPFNVYFSTRVWLNSRIVFAPPPINQALTKLFRHRSQKTPTPKKTLRGLKSLFYKRIHNQTHHDCRHVTGFQQPVMVGNQRPCKAVCQPDFTKT